MITKKLFILFFAIFCVVSGNYLQAMDEQLAQLRAEKSRKYQENITQQYGQGEMTEEQVIEAEDTIINSWKRLKAGDILHQNLIRLPFHIKTDFTDNFGRCLREYSDLARKKYRFQRLCNISAAATCCGALIPTLAYFKKLESLCHGRFKAVAAIVGGVSLVTHGVNKLATWVCNRILRRNYNQKRTELEPSINILKQKMLPETAKYLRLKLERDYFTRISISQSLLNRHFENDFEVYGAARLLQEIQTRDS